MRIGGLDVQRAVAQVNGDIARAALGMAANDQAALDERLIELDGTPNKVAGSAPTPRSRCRWPPCTPQPRPTACRCTSTSAGPTPRRLPTPQVQMFGGGAHAGPAHRHPGLHDRVPGAKTFAQAVDWTAEVYRHAGLLMQARGATFGVADEGGWWPVFNTNEQALEALVAAIERARLVPGEQVAIALDVAASDFGKGGRYTLGLERRELDSDGMVELLVRWIEKYPIVSIEDPLAEDDLEGFARFTQAVGGKLQVVGDDLLVSSAALLRQAAAVGAANTVLLKPNQRGTVTETLQCWQAARAAGYAGIVSARSGETEDTTIVHLAIGWQVGQLKVGAFARSERMAKWNEALRIEERLGARARYAGMSAFGRNPPAR